jgi:hypothetical protein
LETQIERFTMSSPFFRIEMLPARHGDCLWIEYGKDDDVFRVLIDGGPVSTYDWIIQRIEALPPGERAFELIVLTHVDADHVEGLVRLFADISLQFSVEQVWFNGWRQMKKSHGLLGAVQGEFLSALLANRAPRAWNPEGDPLVVATQGALPVVDLPGGMKLTLLSPTPKTLTKMENAWSVAVKKAGIQPGDLEDAWKLLAKTKKFLPKKGLLGVSPDLDSLLKKQFLKDDAVPNGSSIAFLAEYESKSALLLGDAYPDVVAESINRLCTQRNIERLAVDAVKVAHHGSTRNTSETLLKLIKSHTYLISTNGDQFEHPDKECIARIIRFGEPTNIYFNYCSAYTVPWVSEEAQNKNHYRAVVRSPDAVSLKVSL